MKCPNCNTTMDMISLYYAKSENFYVHFACPGDNCFVEYEGTVKRRLSIFEETGSIGYATSSS